MFGPYDDAQSAKTTLREFMRGHLGAEIWCAYRGEVVRKLVVNPDSNIVDIDFGDGEVHGFMDRGSVMFKIPADILQPGSPDGCGKICTELDVVCFDDGTRGVVRIVDGQLIVDVTI